MAADITYHYTGGAGNDDPDLSLGGTGSSEELDTVALNNLFDNVDPDEITGSNLVEYRAIDVSNDGDADAHNLQFYFTDTPNVESTVAVWLDVVGTQSIPNELTEPSGSVGNWTTPLVGSKLSLDNLAPAGTHRLWIRRTVDQDAENINEDTAALHCWFS
jgi:hypothetical protein